MGLSFIQKKDNNEIKIQKESFRVNEKRPFCCRCTNVLVSDEGDFSTTASPALEMTSCLFGFYKVKVIVTLFGRRSRLANGGSPLQWF